MGATKPKGGARPQAFAGTEKSEQFAAELSQSAPPWLLCGRALDATPYEVEFGESEGGGQVGPGIKWGSEQRSV